MPWSTVGQGLIAKDDDDVVGRPVGREGKESAVRNTGYTLVTAAGPEGLDSRLIVTAVVSGFDSQSNSDLDGSSEQELEQERGEGRAPKTCEGCTTQNPGAHTPKCQCSLERRETLD